MQSYTSQKAGILGVLQETYFLYSTRQQRISHHIDTIFRNLKFLESHVEEYYGLKLRDLDILDIGAGQFLIQMLYFAKHNRVVGIDANVIAQGAAPLPYIRMLVANGPRRVVRTLGRKFVGIDGQYRREIGKKLESKHRRLLQVQRMDASRMTFPDETFDFVHSSAVFHHIADPGEAISEAKRVLRPAGVAYIAFHLFSSENGSLDPRELRDQNGAVLRWPHLRSSLKQQIRFGAYINRLRLNDWRELFEARMPGAKFIYGYSSRVEAREDAKALIEQGELEGFSVEELLVHDVTVLWRKPK